MSPFDAPGHGLGSLATMSRPVPVQRSTTTARTLDADRVLREILASGAARSAALGFGYRRLWETLASATEGGKRLRPALFGAAYEAWGGTDAASAAAVGAAIELLHTAFVVHDDVIDGDDTRRGRPNVSGAHAQQARAVGVDDGRAESYGVAAGILAGDLALTAALRALATCPAPRPTVERLLDLFDGALHTTAAGELADVWMSLGVDRPLLEETLSMEERKTGVYSFALPLQAAAVLAGAPHSSIEAAGHVGRLLGISFQLVDDLLGVFGDPNVTGKSCLSDLRFGKQTSLVAHARTTSAWPEIAQYVGRPDLSAEEAGAARAALTACGSRHFVAGLAGEYADGALALADVTGMPRALVSWIAAMITDLMQRAA